MESLQFFHTAAKTSFTSLEDIKSGLTRLDPARGLSTIAAVTPSPGGKKPWHKNKSGPPEGLVSSVLDGSVTPSDITMHSLAWVGAIDLTDKQVQKIKSDFKCWLCRCNSHPWPACPYLSKWDIKKKPETRTPRNGRGSPTGDGSQTGAAAAVSGIGSGPPEVDLLGTANSVRFATEVEIIPASIAESPGLENRFGALATIDESDDESVVENVVLDHIGASELLSADLGVTVTRGNGSFYFTANSQCLGSARAVNSSMIPLDLDSLIPPTFSVVADSGATNPMVPWKELFISYKKCAKASYVLLANNEKAPCLGRGTIKIQLGGKIVIVTNALHVPTLRCPLYSIRCHSRIKGCAFHADNQGVLLAFPEFTLPVDISSDCLLQGGFPSPSAVVSFDERLVGSVSAVSDNTRHRHKRRSAIPSPLMSANCQETNVLPEFIFLNKFLSQEELLLTSLQKGKMSLR